MSDPRIRTRFTPTIEVVTEPGSEWDGFVASADEATFCHLSGWAGVLRDVMGHEPVYLAARDEGDALLGILPMALHRSRIFGSRLISVPLMSYGGPIGEPAAVAALLRRARAEADGAGAALELRTRRATPSDLALVDRKVTVLLPLPDDPAELWSAFKSKVRSQIRRPIKVGMEPRFGPDQLGPFYDIYAVNMRDLGTPALPRELFERIAETFSDEVEFAAVYHQGSPVAAGAGFLFRGEFEITWASSLREFSREAPNMLLYWSVMEEMISRGAHTFNFGRCTPGEGTHRFKLQWGGHDHPLPWLVWPESEADEGGPGRAAKLAAAAWQKLPLPVANRLGPPVARMLPWW